MNIFKDAMKMEQKRIQRLIDLNELLPDDESIGSLTIESRGSQEYCYEHWYQKGKRINKRYLGKPDSNAVRTHVAARFRKEQFARLKTNQQILNLLEGKYQDYDRSSIIAALPKAYQNVISDSAYDERYEELLRWAHADYEKNTSPFPLTENYAIDGTRTRSKGETIFYNIFLEMSIPFRYDCIIRYKEKNGASHWLSPDFLIQCFDGTMIVIEHLGWSTGLKYGVDFGEKCYYYLQLGYVLGKNFFVTSDDSHGGTDSNAIMQTALRVHRMFFGY